MPSGRHFEFSIEVGKEGLNEFHQDDKFYVESNLHIPNISYQMPDTEVNTYGEEETQSWPVTPYTIVLKPNHGHQRTYWYEVYCDGKYIWNKPIRGGRHFTIDGFTKDGVNRELLFSLPRIPRNEVDRMDRETLKDIGCITVRCIEAIYDGSRMTRFDNVKDFSNSDSIKGAHEGFHQANKKDCSRRQGGNQGLMTTKSGREKFRFTSTDQPSYRQMDRFKRGKVVEVLTVHYRMRQALIDMGLIDDTVTSVESNVCPSPTVSEESCSSHESSPEEKKVKAEKIDLVQDAVNHMKELNLHTMNVIDSKKHIKEELVTRFNKDGVEEKILIRQNKIAVPEKRIIHIDDDIQIIEDLDESVVYIGDGECCVIDGPTQEIPYLEL